MKTLKTAFFTQRQTGKFVSIEGMKISHREGLFPPGGSFFWLLRLAVVLQAATLLASASSLVSQYFPMHSGDTRDYRGHNYPSQTVREVFTQTNYHGQILLDLNFADGYYETANVYGHAYLGYYGSALLLYGFSTTWGGDWFNSPVVIMTDQMLTNGGCYTNSSDYGYGVQIVVTVWVNAVGTVTVPYGTFPSCKQYLLLIEEKWMGSLLSYDSAGWVLAPGYGIIQDGVAAWSSYTKQWTTNYLYYDYYELTNASFVPPPVIPGKTVLVSPAGAMGASSNIRYTWKADTNATSYELYISRNGGLFLHKSYALGDLMTVNVTNRAVDVSGHGSGSYQWFVRGSNSAGDGDWSDPLAFTWGIPGRVELLTPTNSASVQNRRPQLSWRQSNPAATYFRLYVTRNGSTYLDQWVQGATNWTPSADLPAGTYTWLVQTYNSYGLGPWSTNATFTVQSCVPSIIGLVSPTGTMLASSMQRYTWKANSCAVWYELYVTRNGALFADKWFTLSNSVVDSATGDFAVDLGGHSGGTYQWYARAWSPDGLGPWSGPGAFTVPTPPPPGAVTLLTPASGANVPGLQPRLTWTQSTPAADWFRLYITRNGSKYLDQWLEGTTNWTATAGLPAGSYSWLVDTYNSAGLGPWSQSSTFTVPFAVPASLVLLSPTGSVAANATQRYTWKADPVALWYELYVVRNGALFADQWFTLSNSVATGETDFAVEVSGHSAGSYQWWVRGWSPDGLGPWSGSLTFQTP